jgi:hypothetical protein
MVQDTDYFRRRSIQEHEAATNAAHPLARNSHLEMAERYDALVDGGCGERQPLRRGILRIA